MNTLNKNLIISTLTVLLFLFISEIGFRVLISTPNPPFPFVHTSQLEKTFIGEIPYYIPGQNVNQCFHRKKPGTYFDQLLNKDGFTFDCINYTTNKKGFRGKNFTRNKINPVRVITLGDSFTFGEGVKENDIYPRLLENRLGIEIINLAVQGLNTHHERILIERNIDLAPDLVILGYVLNDTQPFLKTIQGIQDKINNSRPPAFLKFSKLGSFFYERIKLYQSGKETIKEYKEWFDKGWNDSSNEILKIKKLTNDNNAKFLMILFPIFTGLENDYPFLDINKKIKKFTNQNNIHFINLYENFKGTGSKEFWVHALDQHPNAKAHNITAMAIQGWIKENIKLSQHTS